jgi:hypothetical protein
MATIDPMASLKATAEQRTEDFDGVPLEPESPNRKAVRFSREDRTFYVHASASLHTARSLWDDAYPESPLYVEDFSAQYSQETRLSDENPNATVTVVGANLKTSDGDPIFWAEVTGSVTDTFLGIVTDPDVLLRRAAELDLEHITE